MRIYQGCACFWFALFLLTLTPPSEADARRVAPQVKIQRDGGGIQDNLSTWRPGEPGPAPFTHAAASTTVLGYFTFSTGSGACSPQGWTSVDLTGDQGLFFHIDNFNDLGTGKYVPIAGAKSLWCGTRLDPVSGCLAGCMPGYGNGWEQCWESDTFTRSGDVTVSYDICFDSEPSYDVTYFQYWDGGAWVDVTSYSGTGGPQHESHVIPSASLPTGEVKLRFVFKSDGAWSDVDGLWCTDGAVILDNLDVSDANGPIDYQDFEAEPQLANVTSDGDWSACTQAFGDYACLVANPFQEDPCAQKRCAWNFACGSPDNYSCGGQPAIPATPFGNAFGQYQMNEIHSPVLPYVGTGDKTLLSFCVYLDLPLDNVVFYDWKIRTSADGSCWSAWCSDSFVYYGDDKRWHERVFDVTDCVEPGAQFIQIALGCYDLCEAFCGIAGSGACHSNAPLFTNVKLVRVQQDPGPIWAVQPYSLFQDNLPDGGLLANPVRIDRAENTDATNISIVPGDEAIATVTAPAGLANDLVVTGSDNRPAVYLFARCTPVKSGPDMEDLTGYPYTGSDTPGGYHRFLAGPGADPDEFYFDLADNVFHAGDVIEYFFGAVDASLAATYWSEFTGTTTSLSTAELKPMEVTCLPGPGARYHGGDILYVDHTDGTQTQQFFDSAFELLEIADQVDRFDVRDPAGDHHNSLGDRVPFGKTASLLIPFYNVIIWSSGALEASTIDDGYVPGVCHTGSDWSLLLDFVGQRTTPGGVYLSGDNLACEWEAQFGPPAVSFRSTYLNFNVTNCCHRDIMAVHPGVTGNLPNTWFKNPMGIADHFQLRCGCPDMQCYDVLQAAGLANVDMYYESTTSQGAVLQQRGTNGNGGQYSVMLAGFSFDNILTVVPSPVPARVLHLAHALQCLGTTLTITVTDVGDTPGLGRSRLDQNYPNPFNPTTTIPFVVGGTPGAGPQRVVLRVYDTTGALVTTVLDDELPPGSHTASWDGASSTGKPVASGVYFARLSCAGETFSQRLVLLK
ncbi:MAG TPA: FlgD immunoglobulin-like domain containing protein [Candidatus Krumholzibacteria bacterium]|nr:FlgD immunoglobulin-like domain containing protein [Candidatus Krumholzibacteria bacterium]